MDGLLSFLAGSATFFFTSSHLVLLQKKKVVDAGRLSVLPVPFGSDFLTFALRKRVRTDCHSSWLLDLCFLPLPFFFFPFYSLTHTPHPPHVLTAPYIRSFFFSSFLFPFDSLPPNFLSYCIRLIICADPNLLIFSFLFSFLIPFVEQVLSSLSLSVPFGFSTLFTLSNTSTSLIENSFFYSTSPEFSYHLTLVTAAPRRDRKDTHTIAHFFHFHDQKI